MPNLNHDSLKLHYKAEGEGTSLLFLHGYTATVSLWQAQAALFSATHRVIRLDQRGHGQSDGTEQEGYTLEAMAGDALALLDAEQIEHATVIGHSMGGMVAQQLLSQHNERIKAVVLSSTTPNAPPREYFEATVEWAVSFADIPAETRAADPLMRSSVPVSEATARGCGEMMMTMKGFTAELEGNPTPTLIVHGSDESEGILRGSSALSRALPNVKEVIISGAGHVAQITHTSEYNRALADFFSQLD